MKTIETIFWVLIGVLFYTYIGYGILLYMLVSIKRLWKKQTMIKNTHQTDNYEPEVTILIAAYNEKDYVEQKVMNTKCLNYPSHKLKQLWVTDGSNDGTPELLSKYKDIMVIHKDERKGKIAAMNRAMKFIKTPIVVFTDANTLLGKQSIKKIVELFKNPKTGCVSGEKRIFAHEKDDAATAGEGLYWKYESILKKWDAEFNSAVGAAGELFAIRTKLYKDVENDTLLDDFIISLRVAMKGYKIQYNPEAYAIEKASANVSEELKRKVRISAGGIQSILRLFPLLNVLKYKWLSFQYFSHRVLRWTLAPLSLILVFFLNMPLSLNHDFYMWILILQILFYVTALVGWVLEKRKIKIKLLFVPFYFFMMNYSVYKGFLRFINNTQNVKWERALRSV